MKTEEMQARIASLEATRVSHQLVLSSLIATHPKYEAFQLFLTQVLEQQLNGGAMGNTLTPAQKEHVRETVEWMQMTKSKVQQGSSTPPKTTP